MTTKMVDFLKNHIGFYPCVYVGAQDYMLHVWRSEELAGISSLLSRFWGLN